MSKFLFKDTSLLVFTRAPVPGQCKTRLISELGEEGAAELQRELIRNTIIKFCADAICPVQLWCSPDITHPFFQSLKSEFSLSLQNQIGETLGDKMFYALSGQTSQYSILIGSDIPLISTDYVTSAINTLKQGADVVVGPAEDGGYVLIGFNGKVENVFLEIDWGTDKVLNQTYSQMNQRELNWHALDVLWDIDDMKDYQRYQSIYI